MLKVKAKMSDIRKIRLDYEDNLSLGSTPDLKSWVAILRELERIDGTSLSYPIMPSLELLTSLAVSISSALSSERGIVVDPEGNPRVEFDYSKSDSLGNPLSKKIYDSQERFRDEELSKFFFSLAKIFARIKRKIRAKSVLTRKEREKQSRRLYRKLINFYNKKFLESPTAPPKGELHPNRLHFQDFEIADKMVDAYGLYSNLSKKRRKMLQRQLLKHMMLLAQDGNWQEDKN